MLCFGDVWWLEEGGEAVADGGYHRSLAFCYPLLSPDSNPDYLQSLSPRLPPVACPPTATKSSRCEIIIIKAVLSSAHLFAAFCKASCLGTGRGWSDSSGKKCARWADWL